MREVAVAESGDEEHPPITIEQADYQHGHATKEPLSILEASEQLVADPYETNDPEQIDNEKTALVDDILDADLFPCFQFVFF
jgi:hypothetical protein